MEFEGKSLREILNAQKSEHLVEVFDQNGLFVSKGSPQNAVLTLTVNPSMIGVGNKRRIRYLKPKGVNTYRKPKESLGTQNLLARWEKVPTKRIVGGGLANPR